MVEVLGVHRGDHGDGRRELEEGAVGLVGLGHEELALAELGVGAEAVDAAAHHHGGIEPARAEHRGDEGRRRGLAVGARDGDAVLEPHELGEHLRPRDDGDAALARHLHLDVVGGDGGRVHDDVRALDVGGLVPGEDLGAEALEPLDGVVAPGVGAGDAIAQVEQHLGDAAHADAADAHEVDLLVFLEHGPSSDSSSGAGTRAVAAAAGVPRSLVLSRRGSRCPSCPSGAPRVLGDVQQDAGGEHGHEQRRAAEGDERQRQALRGQGARDDPEVHEGLRGQHDGEPERQVAAEGDRAPAARCAGPAR